MKRFMTLTLALLMAVMLLGVGGWNHYALAEEDEAPNPYIGLWEITGIQNGDAYVPYAMSGGKAYMDFLPSGAIYTVMTSEDEVEDEYLAFVITGDNTLDLYEGDEAVSAVFDPDTGIMTVVEPDSGIQLLMERVQEDPLPDIRALVDHSEEELTYYGYLMTEGGETINMLEMLPVYGMDPRDFYLIMNPDGTGHMEMGSEEAGGDITWTETEFTAEGDSVPYTREGDHIVMMIDEESGIEFAPEGECEALLAILEANTETTEKVEVEIDSAEIVGQWSMAYASAMGQILTAEQMKEQGVDLSFRFDADGSAVMISKGETTEGLSWSVDGSSLQLSVASYDLFTFTYDGEHLTLSMGANIVFEKVN